MQSDVDKRCRLHYKQRKGWSGGAMVLGKLPVPGVLLNWIIVEQGPMLAGGGGGVVLTFFSLVYHFSVTLFLGDSRI